MQISSAANAVRHDPFAKLDELLQRGSKVADQKLQTRTAAQPVAPGATSAASNVDHAYGNTLNALGSGIGQDNTGHALDADRVAELLKL